MINKTARWLWPLAFCSTAVQAVHLDVEIKGEANRIQAGFCRTPSAVGCDLPPQLAINLNLPPKTLPLDGSNGKMIFLSDFRDFAGGPNRTPNPGFQAALNALNPGELVRYRALGYLEYWQAATQEWAAAPDNVRIKLSGGIDPALVITDYNQCGGQLFCFADGIGNQNAVTLYTGSGISGNPEMLVDVAGNSGTLHTHLNWFLENNQGVIGGPVGAYRVEMQMMSNQRDEPSEPFYIMFNAGLPVADFSEALQQLIGLQPPPDSQPQPVIKPIANAGDDRVVRLGTLVTVDGSASSDPQPGPLSLSFNWQQTTGPSVTLSANNQVATTFTPQQAGNYTFKLAVSDGAETNYDEVSVTVPRRGDIDLDGDVDRIDVALILLAVQKNSAIAANDVRDVDGNGVINNADAHAAKAICTLRLCAPTRR
ncbi:MAG: hypothetical protein CTY19_06975 [Methylomonas sp.]|nr:MAG: hypothetical protein CTY19_06975 [Methylomonas sp.]